MSPVSPRSVPLLVASLDLQLVRLIRGAIAANGPNGANGRPAAAGASGDGACSSTRSPQLEGPRLKLRPEPLFLPRPVHRPEEATLQRVGSPLTDVPALPPATGPLPAPWQTLLREKVWNRPVEAPTPPETVAEAYQPKAEGGGILDAFV